MSEGKRKLNVSKFTLSSGKVIYLRDPKISDQEECARLCGNAGEHVALMGVIMNKEMLKQLLVGVQEKGAESHTPLNPTTTNLDDVFEYSEFMQATQAVKMVTGQGESDPNALRVEVVSL